MYRHMCRLVSCITGDGVNMEVWLRRLPLTAPPIVNVEAGVSHVRSVDPLTAIDERKAGEMVVDSANLN